MVDHVEIAERVLTINPPPPFLIALEDSFFANEQTHMHFAKPVKQYVKYLGILLRFNRFRVILH